MDVSALLPGVATMLLALFGGVGGSLLLELLWNPWRARRRVAALLAEEVNLNVQILKLTVHLRRADPGRVSADFHVMRLAFEAVSQEIAALPANVAGEVILVYHYFDRLNRLREMFSERRRRWLDAQGTGQGDLKALESDVMGAFDAFNTLIDQTLVVSEKTLALLRAQAPKRTQRFVSDAEYAERIARSEAERVARMRRLGGTP